MGTMEASSKGAFEWNEKHPESQVKITGFIVSDLFRWRFVYINPKKIMTIDS